MVTAMSGGGYDPGALGELLAEDESPEVAEARAGIRQFLARTPFEPRCDGWLTGFSPEFSRALGAAGWIGLTWPSEYGGAARSNLVRHAVVEELLAAGAPVAAHWFADRQVGPSLLRHGTPRQRARLLPDMARGETYVAVGLSEPESGSDLASVRTRARRERDGWRVTGTKVWTSHAHHAHYLVTLARTADPEPGRRHAGLSQLIVDLRAEGVLVSPIRAMTGEHHFNEVTLDGVFVPDDMVLGTVGDGWAQVMTELDYERSGPERFLSTFPLLVAALRRGGAGNGSAATDGPGAPDALHGSERAALGRLYSRLVALRHLSTAIARAIDAGRPPNVATALTKDLGTALEGEIVDEVRRLAPPPEDPDDPYRRMFQHAQLVLPTGTLRGGTTEIMREIVAGGLAS